ncbi:ATP-binding protein [Calothrix sp. PCC 7507]|uniref:sensor histidine kinase n=1 Tax=Calothrix sp. PCC 7507 TaxID=99598 RepID=UPI00029F2BC0|nr:ATP-binding protein [Calothrix sp. PCC 7507]AFY30939.1 multi-sensor signal transduction histidine kinase [Calothrix sp. PCC 7507]
MNRLSEKFIAGGFSLALLLMCSVGAVSYLSVQKLTEEKRWVIHTHEVLNSLQKMNVSLSKAESGRRGYILTRQVVDQKIYEQEQLKVYQAFQDLRQLTQDNIQQQRRLEILEPLIVARLDLLEQSMRLFRQNSQDQATQIAMTNQGRFVGEKLQAINQVMENEETTLLRMRTAATDARVEQIIIVVSLGYSLSIVLLILVYSLLQKQIRINKTLSEEAIRLEQQAAKAKLANILDTVSDGFVSLDSNCCYTYINQRAGQILNCHPQDLIGKNIWEEFPEVVGSKFYHVYYQAVAEQQVIEMEEYYPLWNLWFENRLYPFPEGLSIFFQDITARKFAEEALQQAKAELEIKVEERTAELQRLNQDLKRSNQELEQFAYVASHDLQEPLRAVGGYSQLLEQEYHDRLDESATEYLAYIVDGATRMRQLIQDLLAYSRIGTRGQVFVPTDCNAVLDQALDQLRVAIAESNTKITHDPLPTLLADKTQLVQLFQNLLGNAIKFRRHESPQIHISAVKKIASAKAGEEKLLTQKSVWLFSVQDNGIGIKPQYLERIFEVFRRLHTRREFAGTGIGLAICKKIVERHTGEIWAESEPGVGTTFYFTLPEN